MIDGCLHDAVASWPGVKDEADRNRRRLELREQRFEASIGELIGNLIGEQGAQTVATHVDRRRLTSVAAAQLLRLERRQVFCLLKAYRAAGPAGLISKRRGRSSNRRKPEGLRSKTLAIIRERYWDFGPTPAFARAGS
jgi:Winged helix-turn helix